MILNPSIYEGEKLIAMNGLILEDLEDLEGQELEDLSLEYAIGVMTHNERVTWEAREHGNPARVIMFEPSGLSN